MDNKASSVQYSQIVLGFQPKSKHDTMRDVDEAVAQWTKSASKYVDPKALFPAVNPATAKKERPDYRVGKNSDVAAEVVQETFVQAFRKIDN